MSATTSARHPAGNPASLGGKFAPDPKGEPIVGLVGDPADEAQNICRECGDRNDDGEGWDGLCGACADAEYRVCEECTYEMPEHESGAVCSDCRDEIRAERAGGIPDRSVIGKIAEKDIDQQISSRMGESELDDTVAYALLDRYPANEVFSKLRHGQEFTEQEWSEAFTSEYQRSSYAHRSRLDMLGTWRLHGNAAHHRTSTATVGETA